MVAVTKPQIEKKYVLAKAVLNAADQLDIKSTVLADILGIHRSGISRLRTKMEIDPKSKQGELAILFIRVYRSLFSVMGGDLDWMKHFMKNQNKVTQGIPEEQIRSITGLVTVLNFLDGLRGKI